MPPAAIRGLNETQEEEVRNVKSLLCTFAGTLWNRIIYKEGKKGQYRIIRGGSLNTDKIYIYYISQRAKKNT